MARILIVDDDPDLAWILDALLREIGYATATAADGAEGFLKVDAFKPDVVLCDVEMPVLSGPGLMQRLLIEDCGRENIPVVLVSGVVDLPGLAMQCGTPYFLEKPVTIEGLCDVVNRALLERQPPRPAAGKGAD
jgi:DNA-binding NtrC family response regulator